MALPTQPELTPAWCRIQAELGKLVGESIYDIWLAALEPTAWDGASLQIGCPGATRPWVSERFGSAIERCVKQVLGPETKISLEGTGGGRRSSARRPPEQPTLPSESFNPRYSFEQFIIGEGNRLAHAAALAVAELPGQAYNPLFLHAPPGLGKTHLLHAIGNYMVAFGAGVTVRYTTAEAFTNHFIAALGAKSLEPFKHAYRDTDVLLIDDVQFLASKTRTEEEFFHTFNALYEADRQLVLTCDRLPRSLSMIETRLRERFEAGLVADIRPPDRATRLAILHKRAALDGLRIADPAALELIADRVTDNMRTLEGALIRVVAYHSLIGRPIDLELTVKVMDSISPVRGARKPSIADVQAAVSAQYGISREELISATRTARVVWPRQIAIHLARELTGAPLERIGQAFGGRNHGTVLHACKRVSQRLADDRETAHELDALSIVLLGQQGDRSC